MAYVIAGLCAVAAWFGTMLYLRQHVLLHINLGG